MDSEEHSTKLPVKTYPLHAVAALTGEQALHEAVELIDNGINPASLNDDHDTPLSIAVSYSDADMVAMLIQRGSPIHILNKNQESPICLAVKRKNLEILALLFEEQHMQQQKEHLRLGTPSTSTSNDQNIHQLQIEKCFPAESFSFIDDSNESNSTEETEATNENITENQVFSNTNDHHKHLQLANEAAEINDIDKLENDEQNPAQRSEMQARAQTELETEIDGIKVQIEIDGGKTGTKNTKVQIEEDSTETKAEIDETDSSKKRLSTVDNLYQQLINAERVIHRSDADIKHCLRSYYGPNPTTQNILKLIDIPHRVKFSKPLEWPIHILGLIVILVCFYGNCILDVVLAFRVTANNPSTHIIASVWLLTSLSSWLPNIYFFIRRKFLLKKHLHQTKWLKLIVSNLFLSFLLCACLGWPALLFCHYMYVLHNLPKHPESSELRTQKKLMLNKFSTLSSWVIFIQTLLQLLVQLGLNFSYNNHLDILIIKWLLVALYAGICLVTQEVYTKNPVRLSLLAKALLMFCFIFRCFHRMFSILIFFYILRTWVFLMYFIHVFIIALLRIFDNLYYIQNRKYKTNRIDSVKKQCLERQKTIINAGLSIYNYIPSKVYEHQQQAVSRWLFLILIMTEDFLMIFVGYLRRNSEYYISPDTALNILFVISLFMILSVTCILIYYKYAHPWRWRNKWLMHM